MQELQSNKRIKTTTISRKLLCKSDLVMYQISKSANIKLLGYTNQPTKYRHNSSSRLEVWKILDLFALYKMVTGSWLKVASDVISCVNVDNIQVKPYSKFGVSSSNFFWDTQGTDFVTDGGQVYDNNAFACWSWTLELDRPMSVYNKRLLHTVHTKYTSKTIQTKTISIDSDILSKIQRNAVKYCL